MSSVSPEFLRFLVSGAINTVLTYVLYLLLLLVLSYTVAYTCCYVVGVFLSYYLNARFVFRSPVSLATAGRYPVVYLVQYVVSIVLLHVLVEVCGLDPRIVPLLVMLVTVPITYSLSRLVITGSLSPRTRSGDGHG